MSVIPPIWRTRPTTPEQHLAAAILAQAFGDMFGGAATSSETVTTVDRNAIAAMRFMTDRHGHSAQWRNRWCDFLDLDGDILATRVRMILDGQLDPDDRFASRLANARDRWARIARTPVSDNKRLPTIKPAPTIDPDAIDLIVPDDPFFVAGAGHIRASRRWKDGEVSRFLGPLPPINSPLGQALWEITQAHRVGLHTVSFLGDPDQVIADLRKALPTCEIGWTSQGKRLPAYQPKAGLRLHLKQLAKAA